MQPRVGVGVFVVRDGRFLMGQRKGSHAPGTWSVPGGWLEYQESFEEAAIREVKEETGLDITNIRAAAVTNNIFKDESIHSIAVWLISEWEAGEPVITEPDKFVDQRWFTFEDLPSPLFPHWNGLLSSRFVDSIKAELKRR